MSACAPERIDIAGSPSLPVSLSKSLLLFQSRLERSIRLERSLFPLFVSCASQGRYNTAVAFFSESGRAVWYPYQGAANLNITRETKVSSGREARRMLGAGGGKSHILTAEELEQCQKYAKVDLLRALRERARADNNLRTFERTFYKKIKSATGPEAFNFEVRVRALSVLCLLHRCIRYLSVSLTVTFSLVWCRVLAQVTAECNVYSPLPRLLGGEDPYQSCPPCPLFSCFSGV